MRHFYIFELWEQFLIFLWPPRSPGGIEKPSWSPWRRFPKVWAHSEPCRPHSRPKSSPSKHPTYIKSLKNTITRPKTPQNDQWISKIPLMPIEKYLFLTSVCLNEAYLDIHTVHSWHSESIKMTSP